MGLAIGFAAARFKGQAAPGRALHIGAIMPVA
jgi:hypothetical protein